jgi:uncharacterized protein YqgC (DUF456 family)
MPFHPKTTAMTLAVIFFFAVSAIGCITGLSPFCCCKRALLASLIGYIAGVFAVKAVNTILISAMVEKQLNQNKESSGGDRQ